MNNTIEFDWRIYGVTKITKDLGRHKKGTPIRPAVRHRYRDGTQVIITPPRVQSLAFNIAINAANSAQNIKNKISYLKTADGKISVVDADLEKLYDYFEYCMIATTFSYQALEAFTNHSISKELGGACYKIEKVRCGRNETFFLTSEELERQYSTDEKLGTILPTILKMKSPKQTKAWQHYKDLKKLRDKIMHFKPSELQLTNFTKKTFFFLLLDYDLKNIVVDALQILEYFSPKIGEKWWTDKIRTIVSSNDKADKYFDY
jgi:hypothetical protein